MLSSKFPKIAVLESDRPYENRVPIHPSQFTSLKDIENIFFQKGYGSQFEGVNDKLINVDNRDTLLSSSDVVFLLKPDESDLLKMKRGAALIGWCHAIQNQEITRAAIKKNLTLIAMEEMYNDYSHYFRSHLFYENNWFAGYCGVHHALQVVGKVYLNPKIAVISYGSAADGALSALAEKSIKDVTVYTRHWQQVKQSVSEGVEVEKLDVKDGRAYCQARDLSEYLLKCDVIINCIKQDVLRPICFFNENDLMGFKEKLIVDISCDNEIGFDFAHATSFEKPIVKICGNYYYAVANIPNVKWREVSKILSRVLFPILMSFSANVFSETMFKILSEAVIVREGVVIDQRITQYQKNSIVV